LQDSPAPDVALIHKNEIDPHHPSRNFGDFLFKKMPVLKWKFNAFHFLVAENNF